MPWGKFEGSEVAGLPAWYLGWLAEQDWMSEGGNAEILEEVLLVLEERRGATRWAMEEAQEFYGDVPQGTPGLYHGHELDASEAGLYLESVGRGEMLLTPDVPCSSRAEAAYRAYCQLRGRLCVVRDVPPPPWPGDDSQVCGGRSS